MGNYLEANTRFKNNGLYKYNGNIEDDYYLYIGDYETEIRLALKEKGFNEKFTQTEIYICDNNNDNKNLDNEVFGFASIIAPYIPYAFIPLWDYLINDFCYYKIPVDKLSFIKQLNS